MKLLVLTAIVAAVASSPLAENPKWPWQVGKEYVYDVDSYTWTKFENSRSNGNAFGTKFIIRVQAPGKLIAKLENPLYAIINGQMDINNVPSDLKFEPVQKLDEAFEILVDGGRVLTVNLPTSFSESNVNLLKGLISALQVDLSSYGHVHNFPNSFDKETFQGLFKKTEADVTGDCETLYSVSPVSAEVRRELPAFAEDPIEITKSKNYASCKKRVGFSFGVPEGAVWNGIAYKNDEKQFIKHTSESRILAGRQGTIYKTESLSSVFVNPLMFGKQKAEVYSYVGFTLTEVKPVGDAVWTVAKSDLLRTSDLLVEDNESVFFRIDPDNVVKAQKILQEITPLLQNPSNLPQGDFLSKFNLLVRFIMLMDAEQLTQMTSSIEVAKISKNVSKNKMWVIYRDAVAQAGSIAAFEEIKAWILTKKIQGAEAAAVISSLAGTPFHTKKVTKEFFELAFSPVVVEQKFLNTSALLAATKFIHSGKQELFIVETVIPRLAQELKKAVEENDSSKDQVYVRTLGNLAHPEILKVFAPYLDGRITVTKYLRTQIVISLKTLANLKNEEVRAVLFSILKNTAEPYDVRVAAALNIFLAFPTAEMMQVMAHMTNDDPSTQVRGVLATSIGFAANLKDPRFAELAKTAQSVSNFVAKEKFGYRASADSIIDEYTSNDELAHFREVSYIGSEDNILPKYHRPALRLRGTGITEENWATLSVSDVQNLFDYIKQTMIYEGSSKPDDFKFSAKKIVEELNIKREPRSPLEGAFFMNNLNQQMLFTFSEKELEAFITESIKTIRGVMTGLETQFTKIVIDQQVIVTFPLASGMPFVFAYIEPTVFIVEAKANTKLGVDHKGTLNTEVNFTYARNLDGSVGFLDTLSGNYASSGVINKFQMYIPANLKTKVMTGELKLTVVLPEQDVNLIHMSVWPYSTVQKIHSSRTVAEESATKLVERSTPVIDGEVAFELIGLNVRALSYSSDFKKNVFGADLLTNIRNLLYQNDIARTQFDVKYVAKEAKNKEVTTSIWFDTLYNQKESGELGPATVISDVTVNSDVRRKEFVKRVASGIESAKVRVIDISTVFEGEEKKEFVLTAALANSVVDNKVQAAVFAHGSDQQINAVFKMIKPKIAPLNFEEALKNEIKVLYEADFKFGNSENILFKGYGERSEQYTEQLKKDPLAKKCLEETSKNNFYQKDCYKMIIKTHAPDFFNGTVTYKDLSPAYYNAFKKVYELYNHFTTWEEQEDFSKTDIKDGTIEIEAQAFYYDNLINYKFNTKYGVFSMKNAEGRSHYPYAMAIYAPITNWERSYNWYTGYQNMPYCAVDSSKIWTFSGRSYDYSLSGSWHAVMVDEGDNFGKWTELAILARRPADKQEEIYISYKTEVGKYVEIDIKPTEVEVKSNIEKVSEGKNTIYWDADTDSALLEYYTLADGVQVFLINNEAIRVVYDSQRLVIFTADHRSTTRGICGQSSSQTSDDYLTPYGLVDLPELYGASFSLDGEFSDPKTAELKKEAKLKAYQPVTKYTNILRSDAEWSKAENESVKGL